MGEVVAKVSFPNMSVNVKKLEYYNCDIPQTDFNIKKGGDKFEIRYEDADMNFVDDTIQEVVDKLREFLKIDEAIISVGPSIIQMVE